MEIINRANIVLDKMQQLRNIELATKGLFDPHSYEIDPHPHTEFWVPVRT